MRPDYTQSVTAPVRYGTRKVPGRRTLYPHGKGKQAHVYGQAGHAGYRTGVLSICIQSGKGYVQYTAGQAHGRDRHDHASGQSWPHRQHERNVHGRPGLSACAQRGSGGLVGQFKTDIRDRTGSVQCQVGQTRGRGR